VNDESRPKAAPESIAADQSSIDPTADNIAFIGDIERRNGWESCVLQFIKDSNKIARIAARAWVHPRHLDLERRRVVDHQPCRARCRSCSACVHSLAFYARGGRSFAAGEVVPPW
jgi:hypothetical protein